jgi:hypothetical protein
MRYGAGISKAFEINENEPIRDGEQVEPDRDGGRFCENYLVRPAKFILGRARIDRIAQRTNHTLRDAQCNRAT